MNEDILISSIPSATAITSGSKIVGIAEDGSTKLFTVSQIKGEYKGEALAATNPGTPVLNQFYIVKPGVVLANFPDNTSTPITVPTRASGKKVQLAFVSYTGSYWSLLNIVSNEMSFRGAWAPSTVYYAYDILTNAGSTYIVTADFTSPGSFDTSNLSVLVAGGANGTATFTNWSATTFLANAIVYYLGRLWKANADTISTDVPGVSAKWDSYLTFYDAAAAAITPDRTTFVTLGKNIFNINDSQVTAGQFRSWTGTAEAIGSAGTYKCTGFIPVNASTAYFFTVKDFYVWYNSAKVAIGGVGSGQGNGSGTLTSPAGAAFVRVSGLTALINVLQVELGTSGTSFEEYGYFIKHADGITPIKASAITPALLAAINAQIPTSITDSSLSIDKMKFMVKGKNLYWPNDPDIQTGVFLSYSGGTVNTGTNALWKTTGYIPVLASTAYALSSRNFYIWYNSAKVAIGGVASDQGGTPGTITSPAGAAFLRVSAMIASINALQVELGTSNTALETFNYTIKHPDGLTPVYASAVTKSVSDAIFALGFTPSKNLFDKSTAVNDAFANWTTGAITSNPGSGFSASQLIPVTPGATYSLSGAISYKAYFNSAGVFVSGDDSGTYPITIPTSPAGIAFIRITVSTASIDTAQFELSPIQTSYAAYGYTSKWPYYTPAPTALKLTTMGDSITAANGWQPGVIKAFNYTLTNLGVSGTALSGGTNSGTGMWSDARINLIPTDTDILTLLAGTNDWAQNKALGAETSVDTNEFNGALNVWVQKIMALSSGALKGKRIILMTTTYGEMTPLPAGWPNNYTNTLGLTTRDYADAIRKGGLRWGLPVVDFSANCGWNTYNLSTFISDGLHPNTIGYGRMSKVVIQKFTNLI